MNMRVVSNTSPLQYLHVIRHLHLLEQLYGQIVVPRAVERELRTGREQGYDVPDCSQYGWMRIESVSVPAMLRLITNLGLGEAEALALALVVPADLVILDDGLARQIAGAQGIRYTGTLGVLVEAKARGLIPVVMPLVDQMRQAGFRITEQLQALVRRAVKE